MCDEKANSSLSSSAGAIVQSAPGATFIQVPTILNRTNTIILVGHFGSGKTEIAVNLAFAFARLGHQTILGDADLVKPYFRCRLVRGDLEEKGISLIAPAGEHFYADLPIMIPAMRGAIARANGGEVVTILDVGGDDTGARILGSLVDVLSPKNTDLLFVINQNRPFAEEEQGVLNMLREIEAAARLPITGLVANTHLMDETTTEVVISGLATARRLSDATGIPLKFMAVLAELVPQINLQLNANDQEKINVPLLPIERHILPPHIKRRPGSRRSLVV
jgi:hypothetical protein